MFAIDGQMFMCYDIFVGAAEKPLSFLQKVLDSDVTSWTILFFVR